VATMYEIDQGIMKRFIWKRIPPDGETIVLADGGDGPVVAQVAPLGDDPQIGIDVEFTSNLPEWVTLETIYDYYRREGMTWAKWKERVLNEWAACRYKELVSRGIQLFAEHSSTAAKALSTRMDAAAEAVHQVPALSQRQYYILQALLELDATSPDKRRPTKDVAAKAEGIGADPDGYKQPVTELANLGFVGTKDGRGGGCWLTAKGKAVAEQLAT
jgi:hypothetical protein